MPTFTTKTHKGTKISVVAANVNFTENGEDGKAILHFAGGAVVPTDVGYDSVRKNVAKALGKTQEADAE